jgi:ubiquinone/menaquinone biosynthesis C-methylase UbiE
MRSCKPDASCSLPFRTPVLVPAALLATLALLSAVAAAQTATQTTPATQSQAGEHPHHLDHAHHRFDDIDRWVRAFEDPARDEWQKPEEVVRALKLQPGQVVADIGAGTGYFTRRFAQAVGPTGKALAVDIEPGMVRYVRERAAHEGQENLEAVQCQPDDPNLAPAGVDGIVIVDTIHHIDNRGDYYSKLARALRPGGWLAIIDFQKRELPVGPPPADKIAREALIAELEDAGWNLAGEETFLPYQYFLIFKPGR